MSHILDVLEGEIISINLPCCHTTRWTVECWTDGRAFARTCGECDNSFLFKNGCLHYPDGLIQLVANIHPRPEISPTPYFGTMTRDDWMRKMAALSDDPIHPEDVVFMPDHMETGSDIIITRPGGETRTYKVTKIDFTTGEITGMERRIPVTTGGTPVDLTTLTDRITVDGFTVRVSEDDGLLACDCSDWSINEPLCPHIAVAQVKGLDVPLMQYENPVKKRVTFPVLSMYEPRQFATVYLIPMKSKVSYAAVLHLACAHGDPANEDDIAGAECNLCNMDPNVASNKVFDKNMLPSNAVPLGAVSSGDGRLALVRMVVAESNRRAYMCSARSHHEIVDVRVQEKIAFKNTRMWEHFQWTCLNLGCCPSCYTLKLQAINAGSGIGRLDEK